MDDSDRKFPSSKYYQFSDHSDIENINPNVPRPLQHKSFNTTAKLRQSSNSIRQSKNKSMATRPAEQSELTYYKQLCVDLRRKNNSLYTLNSELKTALSESKVQIDKLTETTKNRNQQSVNPLEAKLDLVLQKMTQITERCMPSQKGTQKTNSKQAVRFLEYFLESLPLLAEPGIRIELNKHPQQLRIAKAVWNQVLTYLVSQQYKVTTTLF